MVKMEPMTLRVTSIVEVSEARKQALVVATNFVDGIALPKANERGYRDGVWPGFTERIDYILKVADWLLVLPKTEPVQGRLQAPPPPTICGWPVDGSAGPPTLQQYHYAKEMLASTQTDDRPHRVDEIEALRTLIGSYEESESGMPPADPRDEPPGY